MFTEIFCGLGLWLLNKWDLRDTSYYKSQKSIQNIYDSEKAMLKLRLDAGEITQDEYDELQAKAQNKKIRESLETCIRNTQVGCKDFKFDD